MTHAPLFAGINGFGLAADWMGWTQPFHCEIDPFCQEIIKYYWPQSQAYYDIRKTDFSIWRNRIDVLSGGFPCQPYSLAGKRLGKEDERHLWPEMLRAIREIQPQWVVGENVYGLISWNGGLVFEEVQADLEAEGYEVWPVILPAASVNAPHKRDRVWFIAYRTNSGFENVQFGGENRIPKPRITPHTTCQQSEWMQLEQRKASEQKQGEFGGSDSKGATTHPNSGRQSVQEYGEAKSRFFTETSVPGNWKNFPTQSPICSGDDGFSERLDSITFPKWRNESIKAGGNAVVPQIPYEIFKVIDQLSNQIF